VTRVRPPTRHDRLKAKEIRTKEVREKQREGRMDPTPFFVPHLPFYLFYLVFNWSINNDNDNDNVKTFSFFYFRFASFPGKNLYNHNI
jgi:hypothetical protein